MEEERPVSHSEVSDFFELYAYRFETGNLEEVVGMNKTPVTVSHGDPL